jgi:uncharacterized membrane protein YphA (DoxX/SURF4 family)
MNTALWIAQGILAAAFLVTGLLKVFGNRDMAIRNGIGYAEDFSEGALTSIGLLEILAAFGLVLPGVFDTVPILVPWAAVGLMLLMVGAFIVHIRRRDEIHMMAANVILFALAAFVAWGRFIDYPL